MSFWRHQKNQTIVIEGSWAYPSTVIMKFPSVESAQAWCDDPDYKSLAEHRHRSAQANLVIVEGNRLEGLYSPKETLKKLGWEAIFGQ